MKQGSTLFLKVVVWLIGMTVLGICLIGLPLAIASDQTGYYRPIVIGLYIPAIPFFIALYQALKLLDNIDKNKAFSEVSMKALTNIKYCAIVISALFALGSPYVYYAANRDDAPGVLAIDLVIIGASVVIATFAAVLQKLIRNGLDIKSENDLTV